MFLGSQLKAPRPPNGIGPYTVIAFKGLVYDRQGKIVKGGVEGFIPITTPDYDIHLVKPSSEQSYSVEKLNTLLSYPWQTALDSLLEQLLPVESIEKL